MIQNPLKFAFFGSDNFSIIVLEELVGSGFVPTLIVSVPDQPKGRGLVLTPPPIKLWAEKHGIAILQPASLSDPSVHLQLSTCNFQLFVVASYGKIIPKSILTIPGHGTLNVHPSLLPKFRGASPIQSAILADERKTGVTIMLMDEKMDHGPIIDQKQIEFSPWPVSSLELEASLAKEGGALLARLISNWVSGKIEPIPQPEVGVTYSAKIKKEDAFLDLSEDAYKNYLKIKAFDASPVAYTQVVRNGRTIRLLIKDAILKEGVLTFTRVVPEGKKEMKYEDFLRGSKQ